MRVTMRGYARDHGAAILAEEDLDGLYPERNASACPENGAVLEKVMQENRITEFKYRRRVRANLNGNYALEITLAPKEIVFLCWHAFREVAFNVLLRMFSEHENWLVEAEKHLAEHAEKRRSLRKGS